MLHMNKRDIGEAETVYHPFQTLFQVVVEMVREHEPSPTNTPINVLEQHTQARPEQIQSIQGGEEKIEATGPMNPTPI